MKNWVGFLLKHYRLKLNFSQSGVCKGICTVSYLSKIENGTAQPSEEVIEQLFKALGIKSCWNEAVLKQGEKLLTAYFDQVFHHEDTSESSEAIRACLKDAEINPLYLAFKLFEIQEAQLQLNVEAMKEQLNQLQPFIGFMDEKMLFVYELLVGKAFNEEAESAYLKADQLNPCSISKLKIASLYYEKGQFQKALQYCKKAYDLAAYEGNISVMSEVSIIEGGCYCNLYQFDLMIQTYERCLNLNRDNSHLRSDIKYNIGATYLETGCYEKAYEYLIEAEPGRLDPLSKFLTYHKLSLVLYYLNRHSESLDYIEKAEAVLNEEQIQDHCEDIYAKMIQVVRMMSEGKMNEEYLKLLEEVYEDCGKRIIFGFQQFHGHMLIDAYKANRRYKEALQLAMQMQEMLMNL